MNAAVKPLGAVSLMLGTVQVIDESGAAPLRTHRTHEGTVEFSRKEGAIVIADRYRYDYSPHPEHDEAPDLELLGKELLAQYARAYNEASEHSVSLVNLPPEQEVELIKKGE